MTRIKELIDGGWATFALVMSSLIAGIFFALVLRAATNAPVNHWGYDIRSLWPVCAAAVFWLFAAWRKKAVPQRLLALLAACCLVLIIQLAAFDILNVIVEYNEWLERGMPAMWSICAR